MTDRTLPPDVHPESDCRLPAVKRETLDAAAQALYDNLVNPKGTSYVGLKGPGGIRLHSPGVAVQMQGLNAYFRRDDVMSARTREIAILTTARAFDSQFEWAAHEPVAVKAGVEAAVIDAIKHRRATAGLPDDAAAIIELGREIFVAHRVAPATFARARKLLGDRGLVDVLCLMGHYTATAAILCAVDQQLKPGQPPLLPVP
ncbi:MAG: carboxymuconolactone decarboxylase family protein [Alphaproteobacteria bacterium]|nr:carboxymuconolactone decarboxylase family protein [Alphaproteobacteria bacterium]